MLDAQTIATVQATIPLLEQANTALTTHFYQRMFKWNPELKHIFNVSNQHNSSQPKALFNAILAYAKHLHEPGRLAEMVEHIAQKHTGFMILPEHYPIVGQHLLATLQELAPEAATAEVLAAWDKAYAALADIFIQREGELYEQREAVIGGWRGARFFYVVHKERESDCITSFVLAAEDGGPVMDFQPGQYLSVIMPSGTASPYQQIRQYSLSDKPNGKTYRISVKQELHPQLGLVSSYLHEQVNVGDKLSILPPAGDFYLQADHETPVVLISAGVGLTPMMSMLNQLLEQQHPAKIYFLHACEHSEVHAFRDELIRLKQRHTNLVSYTWYREPKSTDRYQHDYDCQGFMDLTVLCKTFFNPKHQYYLCGPLPFMKNIFKQLTAMDNISSDQINYEVFGPHNTLNDA
ncbi:NO-inducible flavohemoprotein [Zooshikella ganghwensis]|uniref:NO-inducible flavohemoprotein n=1 Tax=Zooshikella ganghwensis TaxID=202772 RepID=UPI0003FECD77|nr:NO-inducible flavohemoprotein [Zooshikella ganghwensis]